MTDPTASTQRAGPKQQAIVEVTDHTGRVVDRTAFESIGDAEHHASAEQAKGFKATISSLDPQPESVEPGSPPVPPPPL